MEFLVIPAQGGILRLLGLGLEERGAKMLAAAGLSPAAGPMGAGSLVLYPGERVGSGALGVEIAGLEPGASDVVAATGGPGRPVLVVGYRARLALMDGLSSAEAAFARAAAAASRSRTLQSPTDVVVDRVSAARAKEMLLRSLRKPIDGLVSRTLNRPVSLALSSVLVETPITPNQLSTFCFLLAMVAAGLMATGHFVWGTLVMHLSSVLDGCDGEVARLKYESSRLGGWLDTVFDDVSNNVFSMCAGFGLYRAHGGDPIGTTLLVLAATGFAMGASTIVAAYRRLVQTGTADTGSLDWSGGDQSVPWRRFVTTWLAPLVKRDAYLFLFLLLAIAQVPEAIVVLYAIGSLVAAYTMLTDPVHRAV